MIPTPRAQWFYPKADMPIFGVADRRNAPIDSAAVSTAIASMFDEFSGVELIADGTFNTVWGFVTEGERLAIKLPRAGDGGDAYLVESCALRRVASGGVDAPRVISLDQTRGAASFDFLITTREDGISLRALDNDEDALLASYPAAAASLRRAHALAIDGFGLCTPSGDGIQGSVSHWGEFLGNRVAEHLSILTNTGLITAKESSRIAGILYPLRGLDDPSSRLLHGDCGPHNMILRPGGRVALIDWEDATGGDPLFELAQWATFNPRRRWSKMLDHYIGDTWTPDDLFWLYFLRITIAKLVVRSRLSLPDTPGRPSSRERLVEALDEVGF